MNIKGYDAWKLSGPPEWEGPTCDYCGTGESLRVECPSFYHRGKTHPPALICEDCFTGTDDGPCFDDLQTAAEYYQEQADMRADYLHDQQRDRQPGR
jgi:hypothetical protein